MNKQHTRQLAAALAAGLALTLPALAGAQEHERHEGEHREGERREGDHGRREEWHGDIHRFHEHDIEVWRGGRWFHGNHEGRFGWWWLAAGAWYFYPTPVYPYPDPYQPPVPIVVAPEPPAPPHYYYFCGNPSGYYPYVPRCLVPWQRVTSPPPQVMQAPPNGFPPPGQ